MAKEGAGTTVSQEMNADGELVEQERTGDRETITQSVPGDHKTVLEENIGHGVTESKETPSKDDVPTELPGREMNEAQQSTSRGGLPDVSPAQQSTSRDGLPDVSPAQQSTSQDGLPEVSPAQQSTSQDGLPDVSPAQQSTSRDGFPDVSPAQQSTSQDGLPGVSPAQQSTSRDGLPDVSPAQQSTSRDGLPDVSPVQQSTSRDGLPDVSPAQQSTSRNGLPDVSPAQQSTSRNGLPDVSPAQQSTSRDGLPDVSPAQQSASRDGLPPIVQNTRSNRTGSFQRSSQDGFKTPPKFTYHSEVFKTNVQNYVEFIITSANVIVKSGKDNGVKPAGSNASKIISEDGSASKLSLKERSEDVSGSSSREGTSQTTSDEVLGKQKKKKKEEKEQKPKEYTLPPLVLHRPERFEAHSTRRTYVPYPPVSHLPLYPKLEFPRKWGVPLSPAEPRTVLVGFTCPAAPKFRQDQLMSHSASTLRRYYNKPCIKAVEWIQVASKR